MIKAQLKDISASKELFPQKAGVNHRRSGAFDAADETADLFANKMGVPFTDGSGDNPHEVGDSLSPRISRKNWDTDTGFNIRGAANVSSVQGFTIKGAARSGGQIKEYVNIGLFFTCLFRNVHLMYPRNCFTGLGTKIFGSLIPTHS
jgi:hypothetical protein